MNIFFRTKISQSQKCRMTHHKNAEWITTKIPNGLPQKYRIAVGLSFSTTLCNHHSYTSCNHKNTNREEEPKEPLGIVTEVATIIFLVSFTDFLPFIGKHGIDLTDMRLHLCGHPLAFFGKQFLNLLPQFGITECFWDINAAWKRLLPIPLGVGNNRRLKEVVLPLE